MYFKMQNTTLNISYRFKRVIQKDVDNVALVQINLKQAQWLILGAIKF